MRVRTVPSMTVSPMVATMPPSTDGSTVTFMLICLPVALVSAAASKDLTVAEVRSAIELSPDQQDRLKAALANASGKNVDLKVVVDPSVLGGLVATVGDTVIDGTVRSRLDQVKSLL